MGSAFITRKSGGSDYLDHIAITTMPSKTEYKVNTALDLTGMVITAYYKDETSRTVTNYTTSPADGATLSTLGNQTVTITYAEGSTKRTATFQVSVTVCALVSWANGTDEEIAEMIAAADEGTINLSDYWSQGDERTVTLSAMSATGVGESHVQQTVTLVLESGANFELVNETSGGKTHSDFIVLQKNCLTEKGYMNSSNTTTGGWNSSKRRTWCNSVYKNAFPTALQPIFKQFKRPADTGSGASTVQISNDYFSLASEWNIFGQNTYGYAGSAEGSQFTYYKTTANRVKKLGDSGSACFWWECSSYYSSHFCNVDSGGSAYRYNASFTYGIAPFGCI